MAKQDGDRRLISQATHSGKSGVSNVARNGRHNNKLNNVPNAPAVFALLKNAVAMNARISCKESHILFVSYVSMSRFPV